MNRHVICLALPLLGLFSGRAAQAQENWPQWRGPSDNRISKATNLPTTWSLTENVVWKAPLPSWSAGTPVIWGDKVFVTSPTEGEAAQPAPEAAAAAAPEPGRRRRGGGGGYGDGFGRDPGGPKLLLICLWMRGTASIGSRTTHRLRRLPTASTSGWLPARAP
jgi:hypothetical protein